MRAVSAKVAKMRNLQGNIDSSKGLDLKVIVAVFSSGCLQIGFGVLIIDYIYNFLI